MWASARSVAIAASFSTAVACGGGTSDDGGTDATGGGTGGGSSTGSGGAAGNATGGSSGEAGASTGAGASGGGTGASSGAGGTGGAPPWVDDGVQETSNALDLVLVIDNSISMNHKHQLFADSVDALLEHLVNPPCLNEDGTLAEQPPNGASLCLTGTREFAPIMDMHVGVVTTSLGAVGGYLCSQDDTNNFDPMQNDAGHLLPSVRDGLTSYQDQGFLKWDASGSTAGALTNGDNLVEQVRAQVVQAGSRGCGYEASLEAMYRFLVDPEPYASVPAAFQTGTAMPEGVDETVLAQRAAFLRPSSAVMVVLVTDENDCSARAGGSGWLVSYVRQDASFNLPRATTECSTDPNSPCCRSCAAAAQAPAGCAPVAEDANCQLGNYTSAEDPLNLRCFEQKRRFGLELLYPTSRYYAGFSNAEVSRRDGTLVQNPLFAGGRHPSLVSFALIAGIPWQDLAVDPDDPDELSYLDANELVERDRWPVILGDPATYTPPSDPFMQESIMPRSGTNPITGDAIQPETATDPDANPINGHEYVDARLDDIQYACIMELPQPVDCSTGERGCECQAEDAAENRPTCNPPGGGTPGVVQYGAGAFPSLRQLAVTRDLGRRAVVTSVCSRNTTSTARSDYAYRPNFAAIVERIDQMLE